MSLFYWLGVIFSAAAQTYGLGTVLLVLASPLLLGVALFIASVVLRGK